jgi:hypothetical protein
VTSTRQETPSTHAVDLHYSESGNGEPLVLIMALPSTTGGLALDGRDGGLADTLRLQRCKMPGGSS